MRDVITRFLTFEALNVIPEVYVALAAIWVVVAAVGLTSVIGQNLSWWAKLFWALLIMGVPLLGLSLYCVFCLFRADYSFLKQFGFFSKN